MPRGVLGWVRCELCGNSPATRMCGGASICDRCYFTVGDKLLCEGAVKRVPAKITADVDEDLIRKVKVKAYRRRR